MDNITLTEEFAHRSAEDFAQTFKVPYQPVFKVMCEAQQHAKEKGWYVNFGGVVEVNPYLLLTKNEHLIQTKVNVGYYKVENGKTVSVYDTWVIVHEDDKGVCSEL